MSEGRDRVLDEPVRPTSAVGETEGARAGVRNAWGPSHCPLLDLGGTSRAHGEVQRRPGNHGDSGVVLEETTRPGEGQAS